MIAYLDRAQVAKLIWLSAISIITKIIMIYTFDMKKLEKETLKIIEKSYGRHKLVNLARRTGLFQYEDWVNMLKKENVYKIVSRWMHNNKFNINSFAGGLNINKPEDRNWVIKNCVFKYISSIMWNSILAERTAAKWLNSNGYSGVIEAWKVNESYDSRYGIDLIAMKGNNNYLFQVKGASWLNASEEQLQDISSAMDKSKIDFVGKYLLIVYDNKVDYRVIPKKI